MRYADGPQVQCDIHVEAAPSQVWKLVTDIDLPARLSPELQHVEWIGNATGAAVGSMFVGYNHNRLLGAWQTVSHIVEFEEERAFGWVVVSPDGRFGDPEPDPEKPMAAWRFELEPGESGTTWLRHSVLIGPARSGLSLAIDSMPEREEEVVAFRMDVLRANMDATLEGIKQLAEERAPEPR
ncbi:SRPBCC family protein [Streptomyces sp. NPDC048639]|uniref:SRPBCC family protein n=1 Tax=Streptomyces sp. NPDC048639 TaxID=3365581 RepID=UPI00371AF732